MQNSFDLIVEQRRWSVSVGAGRPSERGFFSHSRNRPDANGGAVKAVESSGLPVSLAQRSNHVSMEEARKQIEQNSPKQNGVVTYDVVKVNGESVLRRTVKTSE